MSLTIQYIWEDQSPFLQAHQEIPLWINHMFFITIFEPGLGSTKVLPNQILLCDIKQRSTYVHMRFD